MTSTEPNKHERRHRRHVVSLFQLGTITANAVTPLNFLLRARSHHLSSSIRIFLTSTSYTVIPPARREPVTTPIIIGHLALLSICEKTSPFTALPSSPASHG